MRVAFSPVVVRFSAVPEQCCSGVRSGLNLLTGETVVGKSILMDALALLLGERASPEG